MTMTLNVATKVTRVFTSLKIMKILTNDKVDYHDGRDDIK